jgi:hypothetical protein
VAGAKPPSPRQRVLERVDRAKAYIADAERRFAQGRDCDALHELAFARALLTDACTTLEALVIPAAGQDPQDARGRALGVLAPRKAPTEPLPDGD